MVLTLVLTTTMLFGCGSSSGNGGGNTPTPAGTSETAGSENPSEASADKIKVGAIFPMTGGNADQGVFNVDGAKLAVEKINAAGGIKSLDGAQLELMVYDNLSNTEQAKAVAERLVNENPDIVAVTGAASSAYVLPMLPIFEKNQIPFLTAQVSESITNQGYNYSFRIGSTGGSFSGQQVAFLEWLNENQDLGLKKIGIIHEDSEWGISNTEGALKAIEASGQNFEIVYNQSFPPNSSDLSNIVLGLKKSGAEVVFPTCYTQDAKLLFNTMATMNYTPLIIGGGGGFLYPSFATELGDTVDGILSVTGHNYDVLSIENNEDLKTIGKEFEEKYGYFMPEQAVATYGAIYLISQALESAGTVDRGAVTDAIRALDIPSVAPGSPVKFDETGSNVNAHAVMIQWQKGEDGIYRTRTVFPENEATAEFQPPESMQK